jgi:tripartite-type tricarboxylate transporter receptor subunit TctC
MIYGPFNGNGPAVNELLGGHVNAVMANYAEAAEYLKAGNLRALAGAARMDACSADDRGIRLSRL